MHVEETLMCVVNVHSFWQSVVGPQLRIKGSTIMRNTNSYYITLHYNYSRTKM